MNSVQQSERVEWLESSIRGGEERKFHLELMVTYPPPHCRSNGVWRSLKREELAQLESQIRGWRVELAQLVAQASFNFADSPQNVSVGA